MKIFRERLRAERLAWGLTQEELGKKAGLSFTHISQFETGKRLPSFRNLKKLCRALPAPADYLMGLSDELSPILEAERPIRES